MASEIFVDETLFWEKLEKIFDTQKSLKEGEIWNRGKMHHWLWGMDAPDQQE